MSVYLKARDITLELAQDLQRPSERPAGFLGALSGTERLYEKVLAGISFEAKEGDRIGVVGLNGAGKTTLLRVLNGAFPPSNGYVDARGTRLSLLNPALGFEERATVIENVFLRGTAIGLRKRQIEPVLQDILEFAGLAERGYLPFHYLSAGQRARLGFALSTAVQPDILLMDEWIVTGDAAFIERARERMLGRFRDSRIVILASHSTALLRELCNKALVLDQGRMRFYGDIGEGLEVYREVVARTNENLRRELANADPLLFGQTLGLIERVSVAPGTLMIEGWAAAKGRREVCEILLQVDGNLIHVCNIERIDRDDVRRHLGRQRGYFGFRIQVPIPAKCGLSNILSRLKVSVGDGSSDGWIPLQLANAAIVQICKAT